MTRGEHVSEGREDSVEAPVLERETLGVSLPPLDLESFRLGFGLARVEESGRKVKPSNTRAGASCGAGGVASAAGDVEHAHSRRDAGAAHAVGVGLRELCNALQRRIRRIGCSDEDGFDARLIHVADERFGFERRHVGDEQAVDARLRRVPHEAGARRDDVGVGQDTNGHLRVPRAEVADQAETIADSHVYREGPLRRRLDHGPVRNRIGEGNADLDHVGAAFDNRIEQP